MTIISLILFARAFDVISDGIYGFLQKEERMERIAQSRIIQGTIQLAALTVTLLYTRDIILSCVCLAAVSALVTSTFDIRSLFILRANAVGQSSASGSSLVDIPRDTLKPLVALVIPLLVVQLLISVVNTAPRYFVQHYLGDKQLGIFAAVSSLQLAGAIVATALGAAALPRLAKNYQSGNKIEFVKMFIKATAFVAFAGIPLLIAVSIGASAILGSLFKPEYRGAAPAFRLLMLSSLLGCFASMLGYALTAARKIKIQLVIFALAATACTSTCMVLIPRAGLYGAAEACFAAVLIQIVASSIVLARALR